MKREHFKWLEGWKKDDDVNACVFVDVYMYIIHEYVCACTK